MIKQRAGWLSRQEYKDWPFVHIWKNPPTHLFTFVTDIRSHDCHACLEHHIIGSFSVTTLKQSRTVKGQPKKENNSLNTYSIIFHREFVRVLRNAEAGWTMMYVTCMSSGPAAPSTSFSKTFLLKEEFSDLPQVPDWNQMGLNCVAGRSGSAVSFPGDHMIPLCFFLGGIR